MNELTLNSIFIIKCIMRRVEDFQRLVENETKGCNPPVQELAQQLLSEWLEQTEGQGQFCRYILTQIRDVLDNGDRQPARKALHRIQQEIALHTRNNVLAEESHRQSAERVKQEMLSAYEVVGSEGRGVVCMGSARDAPDSKNFQRAVELSRETSILLGSTIWNGGGPGIMEAASVGGIEAGGNVAAVKIGRLNTANAAFEQEVSPVLANSRVAICQYFLARKVGLVDAGVRQNQENRTAFVFFPGGFGTMDEGFELLCLQQQGKLGTNYPVPIIFVNYDGAYNWLIDVQDRFAEQGSIAEEDKCAICSPEVLAQLERLEGRHERVDEYEENDPDKPVDSVICANNREALDFLAAFYGISADERQYADKLRNWDGEKEVSRQQGTDLQLQLF